ncbi:hypothetical protein EDB85DRAFT_1894535 [Lactarius pseudohatsudake]|nr:hypothetical protein EDB85DRAFT_1894535 [Lactarius pseudohatsudake]
MAILLAGVLQGLKRNKLPTRRGHKNKVQRRCHMRAHVRGTSQGRQSLLVQAKVFMVPAATCMVHAQTNSVKSGTHQELKPPSTRAIATVPLARGCPRHVHSLAIALSTRGDVYRTRSNVHNASGSAAMRDEEHHKSKYSGNSAGVTRTFATRAEVQIGSRATFPSFANTHSPFRGPPLVASSPGRSHTAAHQHNSNPTFELPTPSPNPFSLPQCHQRALPTERAHPAPPRLGIFTPFLSPHHMPPEVEAFEIEGVWRIRGWRGFYEHEILTEADFSQAKTTIPIHLSPAV